MPDYLEPLFKRNRERSARLDSFFNKPPPEPDWEDEGFQGWLQDVLGRLRGRFEKGTGRLRQAGEVIEEHRPRDISLKEQLRPLGALMTEVPSPGGPVIPEWTLKLPELQQRRFAQQPIPEVTPEMTLLERQSAKGRAQAIREAPRVAERLKSMQEETFAEPGTLGSYLERQARGVLDIAQFVPGGIIGKVGRPATILKKLGTAEQTAKYNTLKNLATKKGLDLEAIEGIAKDEFWIALTPAKEGKGQFMDWLVGLRNKSPETANQIEKSLVGKFDFRETEPAYGRARFLPFKSFEDAEKFLETGDMATVAKKIELKGASMSAEEFAKTKEAMAIQDERLKPITDQIKVLDNRLAKIDEELKTISADKSMPFDEWKTKRDPLYAEQNEIRKKIGTLSEQRMELWATAKPEVAAGPPVAEGAKAVPEAPAKPGVTGRNLQWRVETKTGVAAVNKTKEGKYQFIPPYPETKKVVFDNLDDAITELAKRGDIKQVDMTTKTVVPFKPIAPKAEVPPVPPEKPMGAGEIPPTKPPEAVGAVPEPEAPKPIVQQGKLKLADLQDTEESVANAFSPNNWRKIANKPVVKKIMSLLHPASLANDPATKGAILRAVLREEGQNKAKGVMAYLTEMGTQKQVFGELDDAGRIAKGTLQGLNVNDIRSNPAKYADKLNDAQKSWIQRADDIERGKLDFLKRNGIEVNELSLEEGGQYAGRRVLAKLDKDGNIIGEGRVGAGPGRPGAKLSVEKTRYFPTAEEAIKEGYRYLPDDEALYLNVQGAYNRVADKKMADWVLTKIPWRTTGASEEILLAREAAKIKRDKSRLLVAAINRAVRGERVPSNTVRAIGEVFPDEAKQLTDLIPIMQEGKTGAAKVQSLSQKARGLYQQSQTEFYKAANASTEARMKAMQTKLGEATVRAPAFQGKILTGPEAQEAARILNTAFEPKFVAALDSINKANAIGRYFALAGDASVFGIQLPMVAVTRPKAFAQAVGGFTRALFDTRFQSKYLAGAKDVIDRHPGLLLASNGATEYTEAFSRYGILNPRMKFRPAGEMLAKSIALAPGRAVGKGARTVLEPFQRAFETALDTAGVEMARGLEPLAKNANELAQIDQFINEIRGITSSAKLGVSATQRQLETVVILAPRYNRAIAALLFDSIRGNLRGNLARQALLRTTAGVIALGVGIGLATKENWGEILEHFNPESTNFVTWDVAGQKVGPGTKIRSVLKLAGNISRKVREGKAEDLIEVSPASPLYNFVRGNFSPVISTGVDLLTGRNYVGDPTRDGMLSFSKTVLAENLIPIWLQSTLLEGGDVSQRILRGSTEFFGGRAYPDPYLGWQDEIFAYRKIPTDPLEVKSKKIDSREDTRKKNPDLDAKLFITGQVSSVLTNEAAEKVFRLAKEKGIDPANIKGIQKTQESLTKMKELGLENPRITPTEALTTSLPGGTYQPAPTGTGGGRVSLSFSRARGTSRTPARRSLFAQRLGRGTVRSRRQPGSKRTSRFWALAGNR